MARLLIVDDEPNLGGLLHDYLSREGHEVATASDGPAGLEMARTFNPDLMVLGVMLPGMDGIEVCRQIRRFSDAYILMLTARTEEIDKIIGLSVGADEYVTKPFSPREVVARVKALLRRPRVHGADTSLPEAGTPILRLGSLVIDEEAHTVTHAGSPVVSRRAATPHLAERQNDQHPLARQRRRVHQAALVNRATIPLHEVSERAAESGRRGCGRYGGL